jgi:ubiquinone/menaquinone biosynthesis C-methylase UbiE
MRNSYKFDSFLDRSGEAKRLETRALVGLDDFASNLKKIGLRKGMTVLEVGAGTGTRALELAKLVQTGRVVGIDTSRDLLKAAESLRRKSKRSNLKFCEANVLSSSSLRPLGKFDFIHVRLVIQHLADPLQALRNLKALLYGGGTIFLEETDRDWMSIYPSTSSWDAMYEKMKDGQKKKGGDPRSGRKLGHYLLAAGFRDVSVRMTPVYGDSRKTLEWVIDNAPSYLNFLSPRDVPKGKRILEEIKTNCISKQVFFFQTWFQATARKG